MKRILNAFSRRFETLLLKSGPLKVRLFLLKLFYKYKIQNIHQNNQTFHIESTDGSNIEISRITRLKKLKFGINYRILDLQLQYLTHDLILKKSELVLDIGANIGEFGRYWKEKGHRVISFEPDTTEFKALKQNLINSQCHNIGLWKSEDELTFYSKNTSGDSSFFETDSYDKKITLKVKPLDHFQFDNIGLLKIEAEGAEPEILKGATNTLSKTKYVTVDVGMERGKDAQSTLVEVCNLMFNENFHLLNFNEKRLVLLFAKLS